MKDMNNEYGIIRTEIDNGLVAKNNEPYDQLIDLSIIIPHYNSVDSLIILLDSITDKSNIQIIVIDDKSDRCREEYEQIKKNKTYEHVTFVDNTSEIKGAGICRNIGLAKAKGNWLLFADADDFFLDGFYEIVAKYFNSDNDIIFFSPTSKDNLTGQLSDRHLPYQKLVYDYLGNVNEHSALELRYKFCVPWSKLFRHSFVKDNNIFFDETIASNDVMFSTKTGHHMKLFNVSNEEIYCVTKGIGTLTKNLSEHIFDARVAVFIDFCNFVQTNAPKWYSKKINLSGSRYILDAINYKLGIRKAFRTYRLFIKNKVPVVRMKDLNPLRTFYKLAYHKIKHNKQKKYFIRSL